jgi:hypothetical protein
MGGKPRVQDDEAKLGRKLVRDYLKACGGPYNGFLYGVQERGLAKAIAEALREAKRANKGYCVCFHDEKYNNFTEYFKTEDEMEELVSLLEPVEGIIVCDYGKNRVKEPSFTTPERVCALLEVPYPGGNDE